MNIKASTGGNKKACLSKHCEHLDLKATQDGEPGWMAVLLRVLSHGGTITMTPENGEPRTITFGDPS
jgi:hypothetical protein